MIFLRLGVIYVLLSVALGALGAHALAATLNEYDSTTVFITARDYLAYHGLALVAAGFADSRVKDLQIEKALLLLAVGAAFFSGALFAYALSNWKPITHLAPLGGGMMIIGWLLMLYRVWRR
jgi:uncharacterized membrane protein YgdD (TMEM256/DUF423 family)